MPTIAKSGVCDPLLITRLSYRLAANAAISHPLDARLTKFRIAGFKSALMLGRVGNSAWGRSLRMAQVVQKRWQKVGKGIPKTHKQVKA